MTEWEWGLKKEGSEKRGKENGETKEKKKWMRDKK